MKYLDSYENIIACSTGGQSNSAIAIIRISGASLLDLISPFISIDSKSIKVRYAHFCKLIVNNKTIDEIILTFFKGPNSYNGEDILELSVHGSILNIDRIINTLINNSNVRHAYPGEFSYRALRNKKLSLCQVEGLDLLLNANSVFALDQGFSLLNGKLQDSYKDLYQAYLTHKSTLELGFDFMEDIGEELFQKKFDDSLTVLTKTVKKTQKPGGESRL